MCLTYKVERLFAEGLLLVLCTTTTLAMGVNLPAHLVVIKSTKIYEGPIKGYAEISKATLLQMMGRAGRPQHDDTGVVVIMVRLRVAWPGMGWCPSWRDVHCRKGLPLPACMIIPLPPPPIHMCVQTANHMKSYYERIGNEELDPLESHLLTECTHLRCGLAGSRMARAQGRELLAIPGHQ
jgi:hypothetical protein